MNKIQKWKIKKGDRYIGRDIQDVLGDSAKLRLLYNDGYAGQIYLNLSDMSVWEEVFIWEMERKA
jgi:hypothetical protein